ncbi:MAG: hypothetical protein ACE5J4_01145 [Candidatus Aenigmatarchaeota archaeon]
MKKIQKQPLEDAMEEIEKYEDFFYETIEGNVFHMIRCLEKDGGEIEFLSMSNINKEIVHEITQICYNRIIYDISKDLLNKPSKKLTPDSPYLQFFVSEFMKEYYQINHGVPILVWNRRYEHYRLPDYDELGFKLGKPFYEPVHRRLDGVTQELLTSL